MRKLLGECGGFHNPIRRLSIRPETVKVVENRVHLLAHRIRNNQKLAFHACCQCVPSNRVKRGHSDEPHAESLCDAFGGGHRDANARERTWTTADAHACNLRTLYAVTVDHLVYQGHKRRIRSSMCLNFATSYRIYSLDLSIKLPDGHGHNFVCSVECEHETRVVV